jgi:hypothetical protein
MERRSGVYIGYPAVFEEIRKMDVRLGVELSFESET